MVPYLCRICGHCLTAHARVTSRCQVDGCECTGLAGEPGTPAPVLPADARERYLASVREGWARVERVADVEDFVRAGWDAGFLYASKKSP